MKSKSDNNQMFDPIYDVGFYSLWWNQLKQPLYMLKLIKNGYFKLKMVK